MIIAATLFSGIGAPEVAMPHWRWPWHAEIEKFPSAVMAARHPHSVNLGDVSADGFTERAGAIARPSVLVFGSPCQDFSIAGKRLGLDGARGNLALVALGIADRLKPRWIVFENVPGLLSSYSGSAETESAVREGDVGGRGESDEDSDLAAFLSTVSQLGYSGPWASLDAQWFGVAQRRERLFFVGYSGDWRRAAAILLEPESLRGDHPPRRQTGERPAPTIASRPTGGGGLGTDFDCDGGLITGAVSSKWSKGTGGPSGDECYNLVAHALRADGFDASEDGTVRGTPLIAGTICKDSFVGGAGGRPEGAAQGHFIPVAFSCKDHGADAQNDLSPTLRAGGHDASHANAGVPPAVAFQTRIARNGRGQPEDIVPTFNGSDAGATSDMRPCIATDSAVRRLTPRECERLQGFPDDYTLINYRGKPAADGPRYKALGNSMAVPVVRWILNRIEMIEATDA